MKKTTKAAKVSIVPTFEEVLAATASRPLPVIAWGDQRYRRGDRSGKPARNRDLVAAFGAACEHIRNLEVALARIAGSDSR